MPAKKEVLELYAIISTGGKQVKVEPGQTIKVERLPAAAGANVEFTEVMMIAGEDQIEIGQPFLTGAKVRATVLGQGKSRKILVFRYKAKKNVRKRRGHRQPFTMVRIDSIEAGNRGSETGS